MSQKHDYSKMLAEVSLYPTPHRLRVLRIIGDSPSPLSHREIQMSLRDPRLINRVTLYRILDLLVEKKLVERIRSGDRSYRYGLDSGIRHSQHPHFYCSECGYMRCLGPETLRLDVGSLLKASPGLVKRVDIRLDGICDQCLNSAKVST
ncbi:MAG: transcriptional repressor [Syntrophobacteraceae bacterium]